LYGVGSTGLLADVRDAADLARKHTTKTLDMKNTKTTSSRSAHAAKRIMTNTGQNGGAKFITTNPPAQPPTNNNDENTNKKLTSRKLRGSQPKAVGYCDLFV